MADTKISDLPEITTPADASEFAVVQSGATNRVTWANIKATLMATANTWTGVQIFSNTKFALRNVANTFNALFTNTNTADRTYTLQDRNGTLMDDTDLATKMTNPMTNGGDVIYGGDSGAPTILANGTAGQVLTSGGTTLAPTWETPSSGAGLGLFTIRSFI